VTGGGPRRFGVSLDCVENGGGVQLALVGRVALSSKRGVAEVASRPRPIAQLQTLLEAGPAAWGQVRTRLRRWPFG